VQPQRDAAPSATRDGMRCPIQAGLAPAVLVQLVPRVASEVRPPSKPTGSHPLGPPRFLANCVFLI
jgi:hypothetical protein